MSEEEYLDVLDESGNKTGKKELKSKIHAKGLWHNSAHIWILNSKGQLLLQKRSPLKISHPNQWDISAAGHCPAGLESIDNAIKEINEELGVSTKPKDLIYLFRAEAQSVQNNKTFFNNEFDDVYLLEKDLEIDKLKLQKEEVSEAKWFDIDTLKNKIANNDSDFVPHPSEYPKLFEILKEKYVR